MTSTNVWSQTNIAEEKARVKTELDAAAAADAKDPHARLHAALAFLAELEHDDTDIGRLRRYIYAMSALVQHERTGGLSAREVNDLVTLAYAILQAQGVRPRASRIASLFGDIHLIRSQIFRKEGDPWRAAWEQQVALQLAGEFPSGGLGFQLLAMANRALRLGHGKLALAQFAEAEARGITGLQLERCRLGRIHALWLGGAPEESDQLATETLQSLDLSPDIRKELEWLSYCRAVQQSHDLNPMLKAVRSGGTHYVATYIIEACFWAMTLEGRGFLERLPRLGALRRNKTVKPQRLGLWFEAAEALQEGYDHGIPLPFRLKAVSRVLDGRASLLTVDKELLLLGAATRWLARSKSASLAALVYSEYRALSQRIGGGTGDDALGLLGDLRGRDWLTVYFSPGSESESA